MGFKISARVGERFFKHFVFQIHFSKTKPVQAKFESQKWRQEENVSCQATINCQTILSQSIAKRSCRNQLPNDPVKINYQGKMSEQKMCLAPSTTPQGSALPSGLLLSIMEALKLNLVGNFQIS
jgi:hypothetical protein